MKIGTFHLMGWDLNRSQAAEINDAVEQICLADQLGYYSSWTVEHHFPRPTPDAPAYSLCPDPLTFLGHVAGRTRSIRLGTGIVVAQWDQPVRIAERAALVDILSGGRLELGIGRGGSVYENAGLKVKVPSRDEFQEDIEVILGAWDEAPLTYHGRFHEHDQIPVHPKPLQKPRPDLYVAATSPESFAWIGALGLPYCHAATSTPVTNAKYRKYQSWYTEAAAAAGRDITGLSNPHVLLTYCAPTDEEAVAALQKQYPRQLASQEGNYEFGKYGNRLVEMWKEKAKEFPQYYADEEVPSHASTPEEAQAITDAVASLNLIGSPATLVKRLQSLRDEAGIDYVLLWIDWLPHEMASASLELFAREVIPALTAIEAAAPAAS
jgi:alkanesulfonate monooxygenase SsuD/methylene tetrahydromethanopterin reductase-like flavin-dependent oxidoreductase (luciferase family)